MSNPVKILVVEDEAVIRLDLQDRLESLGHQVVGMTDTGADAIRLAKTLKPELVFMDIRLKGGMDGITAAEYLHGQLQIPVIYLTAFADDEMLLRAKLTGPFGYLHKPCQDRDLKTAIEIGLHKYEVERKLRESEQRYKTTINSIGDGIIAVDSNGKVMLLNPVAERVTGWPAGEAHGQPVQQVFSIHHPQIDSAELNLAQKAIKSGQTVTLPEGTLLRRRDGSEIPIGDSVAPIFEGNERRPTGAVVAFRDISERLKSEAQLRHVQKLESLGVMSSGIAHDFNNLLTPILGFAGLLRSEVGQNARAIQMVEQIENGAKRAADLTKQLLSYTGQATMAIRAVNLTQLAKEMMALLRVSISRKAIMTSELADPLPQIEGDESQIQQIMLNLITNASEALRNGIGNIRLKTGERRLSASEIAKAFSNQTMPPGDYVFFEVSDDGAGMTAETMSKIFDPFYTTKFTGRGLGLSAVLGIIQAHHAVLFLESELGKGTIFRVFFPRSHRQFPMPSPVIVSPAPAMAHGQILIVEDEKPIQQLMKLVLEKAGYRPIFADDGQQAIDRYGDRLAGVDLAIIDLLMPRKDGLETIRELRIRKPEMKVILMSGFSPEALSAQLTGLVVSAILQKPFRTDSVLSIISTVLKR